MAQTLSDNAQQMTIAFDGLAFLTGTLGADSFFPPGKVADFWGFQYLRDNDPSEMGHNTDFLTNASLNMLTVLSASQKAQLITLAKAQVASINQYGSKRFVLMTAFRRLLTGDLPTGSTGLDVEAVKAFSTELYHLDGEISYARAQVMGNILANLDATQRAYLDAMVGKGMTSWPTVTEPVELRPLTQDEKVAVMTYAGDLFSWYAGSVDADVYFCPERQGTYFGSFYMKDAPAVGNPGYSIGTNITADLGKAFLAALTPAQAALVTDLVTSQKPALYEIVDRRKDVSTLLRQFIAGQTPDSATVLGLMDRYGALDGDIIARYATAFAQVGQSLSADQQTQLVKLRTDLLDTLAYPSGAYLFAKEIAVPSVINTDFLFTSTVAPTITANATTMAVSEGAGTAAIMVTLSTTSTLPITVGYATSDGTATAPADYTAVSGALTFAPNETSKTITIPIVDDTLAESDETLTLALRTPTNALLGTTASTTITISANDGGSNAVKYHAYVPLVVR
ncbi:MAG: Calx-beta domain-containing protein [Chloroflexales bacterium]